ncbi:DUF779 domain-containing protein [Nesterenkonia alkaliphila]|uniref:DUF779 domain-containing protein n=1 Tax=Nesterenkonia alkaliphila TaxID=1463631 RepID=A0A7K1ULR8_9MICC|nr:DUF779 domain-containing protein [Nesterenkonia alkaliphila]MVT27374.1 DUF779 domain-containing protein [Nesterenkonia alkaliphila]GFZ80510.1 hypothetical protein GCM10011359_06150 [Nesterenkonia alkaliphila]
MGAERVAVTDDAAALLRQLRDEHGQPLMFHQSGGCCDGSAPMCYTQGTFMTGPQDVLLGQLEPGTPEPVPVWISKPQFEYWAHTHITIDVTKGRGSGFSIEGPTGNRFIVRSRLFTEQETAQLEPVSYGSVA